MNRSTLQVLGCYILWGLLPVFWKLLAGVNAAYVLAQRIVFSCYNISRRYFAAK